LAGDGIRFRNKKRKVAEGSGVGGYIHQLFIVCFLPCPLSKSFTRNLLPKKPEVPKRNTKKQLNY
jgi:hypothetical protein